MPKYPRTTGRSFENNAARRAIQNALGARERRRWARLLSEAQEAVEAAEEERTKLIVRAYDAGVALSGIENATGLGPQTVRKAFESDAGRTGEGSEGSS